jgi:hypothetical protein
MARQVAVVEVASQRNPPSEAAFDRLREFFVECKRAKDTNCAAAGLMDTNLNVELLPNRLEPGFSAPYFLRPPRASKVSMS